MRVPDDDTLKMKPETKRWYEAVRHYVMEIHLFDADADEETALCGGDASEGLRSLQGYLEDRARGYPVGAVSQGCKYLAVPLAEIIIESRA